MKSKCKCGDAFGFKVSEALQFIAVPEREQALRRFVSETKRGCIGETNLPWYRPIFWMHPHPKGAASCKHAQEHG